jgi:hypothetical protein
VWQTGCLSPPLHGLEKERELEWEKHEKELLAEDNELLLAKENELGLQKAKLEVRGQGASPSVYQYVSPSLSCPLFCLAFAFLASSSLFLSPSIGHSLVGAIAPFSQSYVSLGVCVSVPAQ